MKTPKALSIFTALISAQALLGFTEIVMKIDPETSINVSGAQVTPLEGKIHMIASNNDEITTIYIEGVDSWFFPGFSAQVEDGYFNIPSNPRNVTSWAFSGYFWATSLRLSAQTLEPIYDCVGPDCPEPAYTRTTTINAFKIEGHPLVLDVLPAPDLVGTLGFQYGDQIAYGLSQFPYIYNFQLGYFYAAFSAGENAFWSWDFAMEKWLWVDPRKFPWMYDVASADWIAFLNNDSPAGTSGQRREFWSQNRQATFTTPYYGSLNKIP